MEARNPQNRITAARSCFFIVLLEGCLEAGLQCLHLGRDQQGQIQAVHQNLGLLHHHILVGGVGHSLFQLGLDPGLGQLLQGTEETPEMQCERIAKVTREDIVKAANTLRLDTVYCLTGLEEEAAQ